MVHYDYGDYEIDKEEIPQCKAMFKKNFSNARFIRSYFSVSNTSTETYYNIEYENDGERNTVKFCLDYDECEQMVELLMLDTYYEEIDSDEIKFARG